MFVYYCNQKFILYKLAALHQNNSVYYYIKEFWRTLMHNLVIKTKLQ